MAFPFAPFKQEICGQFCYFCVRQSHGVNWMRSPGPLWRQSQPPRAQRGEEARTALPRVARAAGSVGRKPKGAGLKGVYAGARARVNGVAGAIVVGAVKVAREAQAQAALKWR